MAFALSSTMELTNIPSALTLGNRTKHVHKEDPASPQLPAEQAGRGSREQKRVKKAGKIADHGEIKKSKRDQRGEQ